MGLCKCPKKKVTNQFCFEHRVNVCEHCLVSNHPRCIVKSYLHWLQDSDYNPVCTLCNGSLAEGDVIRLVCYDVFHLACIDKFSQSLPPNTAPAGYTCPNCKNTIFPPEKMVSPVVDQLRHKLSSLQWARAGLGLPVVSCTVSRKTLDKRQDNLQQPQQDHDENKYQRRGAIDWFTRWFRTRVNKPKGQLIDDPNASLKRTMMVFFLVILAFVTIVVIFTRVGRSTANRDPLLDPMSNPNIKVQGDH
ncbi:zinc finger protein-like 1 homolog [Exaiptasia diaphana]|uniref:RING-type domain-containing protein n=1 Tax=Exaiptasia diaphana TaxID=2652724 RepID=A0A913YBW5_EXADI|nr:zinc finger protein-like 1 homolog [Exaiptasia diaphana]